jgi:hypothetical protein
MPRSGKGWESLVYKVIRYFVNTVRNFRIGKTLEGLVLWAVTERGTEDYRILGYSAVKFRLRRPTFHKCVLTLISVIMETVGTYETSVYFNETTQRYIPEDCNVHTSSRQKWNSRRETFHHAGTLNSSYWWTIELWQ